jgi:hypothetical protein
MTNPTNPFNWQMPTASDLVTDLPADFETFGQAVATSMADLLGGTTGQVLSKASNTDMDFTWVAQDDSNAIQNAIVDAKGDLIAASAADTPARLAVGNNGETLVADNSTSTGLRYIPATVMSNPVINSCFDIWQRGTSFTTGARIYGPDRFYFLRGGFAGGVTVSRQVTGDTTNLPNVQYSCRVQRDSGNTSTAGTYIYSDFESVNSIPYAGKTVSFSFYARRGANYSASSNVLSFELVSGTGTDQALSGGYTGGAAVINSSATLTTTWQRFTYTGTVPTTATQLGFYFGFVPTGTAGAADWYEITGIQVDVGSVALPIRRNGATIQGELDACQRYLPAILVGTGNRLFGWASSTTVCYFGATFPVTARVKPTGITSTAASNFTVVTSSIGTGSATQVNFDSAGVNSASLQIVHALGSPTNSVNTACQLAADVANCYVLFTGCEL